MKSAIDPKTDNAIAIPKSDKLSVFDKDHATAQIRMWITADAIAKWHVGKWLCLGKESLKHGEFTNWLDELGLNPRTAQRHMKLAETYSTFQIESMQDVPAHKMLALTEGPDGLEPAELKKMSAEELRAEVEKLMKAREIGQQQLEDLQSRLDSEKADNELLEKQVKRLKGMKFDSSRHGITAELARLAYEIERLSELAEKIDPNKQPDVADGIIEHVTVLNSKLGVITRHCSVATRKRA